MRHKSTFPAQTQDILLRVIGSRGGHELDLVSRENRLRVVESQPLAPSAIDSMKVAFFSKLYCITTFCFVPSLCSRSTWRPWW